MAGKYNSTGDNVLDIFAAFVETSSLQTIVDQWRNANVKLIDLLTHSEPEEVAQAAELLSNYQGVNYGDRKGSTIRREEDTDSKPPV